MDEHTENRIKQQVVAMQEAALEYLALAGEHIDDLGRLTLDLDGTTWRLVIDRKWELGEADAEIIVRS